MNKMHLIRWFFCRLDHEQNISDSMVLIEFGMLIVVSILHSLNERFGMMEIENGRVMLLSWFEVGTFSKHPFPHCRDRWGNVDALEAPTTQCAVSDYCEGCCGRYGYSLEITTSNKCLLFNVSNFCVDGYGLLLFLDDITDLPSCVLVVLIQWHDWFILCHTT